MKVFCLEKPIIHCHFQRHLSSLIITRVPTIFFNVLYNGQSFGFNPGDMNLVEGAVAQVIRARLIGGIRNGWMAFIVHQANSATLLIEPQ